MSVIFQWLVQDLGVTSIDKYSIGILNYLMILSLIACYVVCYYLLLEFNISPLLAILFSIAISLLAPQIARLGGHYALSYPFAIPLAWLLLIRWLNIKKNKYFFILLITTICWMFIHAYLGIIVVAFIASFLIVKMLRTKNFKANSKTYGLYAIVIFLPVFIFLFVSKVSDEHVGRTDNPSGFYLYNSQLDDILIPSKGPVRTGLDLIMKGNIKLEWEGAAYVGFPSVIVLIVLLVLWIRKKITKKEHPILKEIFANEYLRVALIGSLLVLVFAFGYPFRLYKPSVDFFAVLKQFRATGRFSWCFYYVAMVIAALGVQYLWKRLLNRSSKYLAYVLLLIIGVVYWSEGNAYQVPYQKGNLFDIEQLTENYKNC